MLKAWEAEAVSGYTTKWVDGKPVMGESFDNGCTGWHYGYDAFNRGAYLYNDNEKSPYYCWYISYETPMTLQDKLDFIEQKGIAGLIVWECSQDTAFQNAAGLILFPSDQLQNLAHFSADGIVVLPAVGS